MATQREKVRHTEYHMQKGRKERHSCIDKVFDQKTERQDAHFKGRFYKLTSISQLFTCSCLQVPLCHNQKVKATDKKHSFINQIILYMHSLYHYDTNHNFEFAVQKSLTL